ncbi:MAG TPA: hypothetical protein VFJ16_03055 [Longimicrobium sp.]|nr:hypothetical protein [Longimicrobium sp.]
MDADSREMLALRGESWFQLNICKKDGAGRPLFRPAHLGGKWPTVDYLVEAVGRPDPDAFFFAQVKCSENANGGAIPVTISDDMWLRLRALPAPTYIFGIDDVTESGYILSVNGYRGPIRSVPRTFPLDVENRERLWNEVVGYWERRAVEMPFTSVFRDPRTR